MSKYVLYAVLIVVFLILSGFFSGMEAAIFSISRFRVKTLVFENRRGSRYLAKLKEKSGKALAAILLSNLLVNIGASSVGALILFEAIKHYPVNSALFSVLEFGVMTSLLLIIGEITPKTIALVHAEILALRFGNLINWLSILFSPVSIVLEKIAHAFAMPGGQQKEALISDKELKVMLSEAKRYKILDEGEEKFGYQILRFGKMRVNQLMTPRNKVVGIKQNAGLKSLRNLIVRTKHSRICVFDEKKNVIGLVYAKDLFIKEMGNDTAGLSIAGIMRDPYIIPETKHLDSLLAEFRQRGIHIAVVVDEFGDFAGIVTLEDIIESLFGEIVDEYDSLSDLPYEKLDDRTYLFSGDVTIGEAVRVLDIEPFGPEEDRLAACILNRKGKLPKENEQINIGDITITVVDMHDRYIDQVRIEVKKK